MDRGELQLRIAKALYARHVVAPGLWDSESRHVRDSHLNQAGDILALLDGLELKIIEKGSADSPNTPESLPGLSSGEKR